ncbi:cytochrome b/b6 domain-containing protein [Rhodohalobacter sp. 614A]|uniref:cytochrome b/b6 domain-containing protein n=1 Tax=Rhodohalobacter sp. 614A TaxID=2908649 RepID=UPI001F46B85D|nr:cytochrome b/b6 domain-containing protein [Rhodohalobacter sp. 614A]
MKKIKKYKRFERFWHWGQAALILFLAVTGFEVHDSIHIFGFEKAVMFHRYAAYALLLLIGLAIFWHFTTDEWRNYIPTLKNIRAQLRYYTVGMFRNEPHPTLHGRWQKLNPLQIFTYLAFKILIVPIVVLSGLLYMFHKTINANDVVIISDIDLSVIAAWHTFGAFILVAFIILHVYMTTTGDRPTSNIRAMVTGYEELETKSDESEDETPSEPKAEVIATEGGEL